MCKCQLCQDLGELETGFISGERASLLCPKDSFPYESCVAEISATLLAL